MRGAPGNPVAAAMMFDATKRVRALLRQLATTAYERELQGLLDELERSFVRWRQGQIDVVALAEEVDRFARGPARRRLEDRYRTTSALPMSVAWAIVRGILKTEEVPKEVLDPLGNVLAFYVQ